MEINHGSRVLKIDSIVLKIFPALPSLFNLDLDPTAFYKGDKEKRKIQLVFFLKKKSCLVLPGLSFGQATKMA